MLVICYSICYSWNDTKVKNTSIIVDWRHKTIEYWKSLSLFYLYAIDIFLFLWYVSIYMPLIWILFNPHSHHIRINLNFPISLNFSNFSTCWGIQTHCFLKNSPKNLHQTKFISLYLKNNYKCYLNFFPIQFRLQAVMTIFWNKQYSLSHLRLQYDT